MDLVSLYPDREYLYDVSVYPELPFAFHNSRIKKSVSSRIFFPAACAYG